MLQNWTLARYHQIQYPRVKCSRIQSTPNWKYPTRTCSIRNILQLKYWILKAIDLYMYFAHKLFQKWKHFLTFLETKILSSQVCNVRTCRVLLGERHPVGEETVEGRVNVLIAYYNVYHVEIQNTSRRQSSPERKDLSGLVSRAIERGAWHIGRDSFQAIATLSFVRTSPITGPFVRSTNATEQ